MGGGISLERCKHWMSAGVDGGSLVEGGGNPQIAFTDFCIYFFHLFYIQGLF